MSVITMLWTMSCLIWVSKDLIVNLMTWNSSRSSPEILVVQFFAFSFFQPKTDCDCGEETSGCQVLCRDWWRTQKPTPRDCCWYSGDQTRVVSYCSGNTYCSCQQPGLREMYPEFQDQCKNHSTLLCSGAGENEQCKLSTRAGWFSGGRRDRRDSWGCCGLKAWSM